MAAYILLNADKIYMLKTNKSVNMHPVYSIDVCITMGIV
jgi:hypothetical protein